jgi:hypothetical protein
MIKGLIFRFLDIFLKKSGGPELSNEKVYTKFGWELNTVKEPEISSNDKSPNVNLFTDDPTAQYVLNRGTLSIMLDCIEHIDDLFSEGKLNTLDDLQPFVTDLYNLYFVIFTEDNIDIRTRLGFRQFIEKLDRFDFNNIDEWMNDLTRHAYEMGSGPYDDVKVKVAKRDVDFFLKLRLIDLIKQEVKKSLNLLKAGALLQSMDTLTWLCNRVKRFENKLREMGNTTPTFLSDVASFIQDIDRLSHERDLKVRKRLMCEYCEYLCSVKDMLHESVSIRYEKSISPPAPANERLKYKENRLVPLNPIKDKYDKNSLKDQLQIGIQVEMEHTSDPKTAKKIALDHLKEIPDYYTRLTEMEAEAENEGMMSNKKKIDLKDIKYA